MKRKIDDALERFRVSSSALEASCLQTEIRNQTSHGIVVAKTMERIEKSSSDIRQVSHLEVWVGWLSDRILSL